MQRQVCTLVEGLGGAGKTYAVVQYLCDTFLSEEEGQLFTNLALNIEAISQEAAKRSGGKKTPESIASRIRVLTPDEVREWMTDFYDGGTTPRVFFGAGKFKGALVVMDEAHLFIGKDKSPEHCGQWLEWLGELRKAGMSLYLITQSVLNLHKSIVDISGCLMQCVGVDELRDPFFNVALKYWYQLEAKIRGKYSAAVEARWSVNEGRRWVIRDRRFYRLREAGFGLYESFSARQGETESGERPLEEWEKRTFLGLVGWAVAHNFDGLVGRPLKWIGIAGMLGGGAWYAMSTMSAGRTRPNPQYAHSQPKADAGQTPESLGRDLALVRLEWKKFSDRIEAVDAKVDEWNADRERAASVVVGIVGERFLSSDGVWHDVGDTWAKSTVASVDARLGLVRLSDGSTKPVSTRISETSARSVDGDSYFARGASAIRNGLPLADRSAASNRAGRIVPADGQGSGRGGIDSGEAGFTEGRPPID